MLAILIGFASLLDEHWSLDLFMLLRVCELQWLLLVGVVPHVLSVVVVGDIVDNVVDSVVDYGDISFRLGRKVGR